MNKGLIILFVMALIAFAIVLTYIKLFLLKFTYNSCISDRHSSKSLLQNTILSYNPITKYESHGRLFIIKDGLPYGNSCNASLIVKHQDNTYSNKISYQHDRVLLSFCNMYWLRKFVCELDYYNYKIKSKCENMNLSILYQDGRLFNVDGKLFMSVTMYDNNIIQKQGVYDIENKIHYVSQFNYNKSLHKKEKNWQFFQQDNDVFMIYFIKPFEVYKVDKTNFEVIEKVKHIEWEYPNKLRCSVPPVFVDNKYYMLIHSHNYRMYLMTFDRSFNILKVSSQPLCDHPGDCQYLIYFPCGLIYNNLDSTFLISMGVNDNVIGLMKYTKDEFDALLDYII